MMNILYVSASVIPSQSADSVHVMKMCSAFVKNGHKVKLVGIKGNDGSIDPYSFYNVEKNFDLILNEAGKVAVFNRVLSIIREAQQADVIYTRYAIAAYICGVILSKKVFYEYHYMMDKKYNRMIENRLAKKNSVTHIFITQALRNAYVDYNPILYSRKTLVMPDGADLPNISVSKTHRKTLTCGYIGSFLPGKGIELVIEIANSLPEFLFHIVGGNENEIPVHQAMVKNNNIIWHGYLNQSEAMKILNDEIDIALLPNQKKVLIGSKNTFDIGSYTSPMKLFEYMSFKKAIVASKLPVLEEILTNKKNALLVDSSNVEAWCVAIRKLQEDRVLFNSLAQAAYETLERNYTWQARAQRVLM